MAPNCHECVHSRPVPGDAHLSCAHPATNGLSSNPHEAIFDMFLKPHAVTAAAIELGIVANKHGVRMGWFLWPANFDPNWLVECNGFKARQEVPRVG